MSCRKAAVFRGLLAAAIVALLFHARTGGERAEAAEPDRRGIEFFEKKIRPVLVKNCYECHSSEAANLQGGLLLDTRAGLHRGGDSGPAVVPGKGDEGWLLDALRHETFEMPPQGKLPDAVIADFEKWVEMGAPDPRDGEATAAHEAIDLDEAREFWSFQPVRKPPVPGVENTEWPASTIDRFILARLEEQGLSPSAPADKQTLIRRLTFDLTGLPPTPEEIDRFLGDDSPEALPRLVDRLLDSPRFGERWGRHWLDVARFAESSGGGRSLLLPDAWRYRDYVIDSFNRDKPFDRFIREQIAGDLLSSGSPAERHDQLVATGFLALGPTNYETQDKELLRMDVVDEQIDTMGRAFLGMTIGCARCHDHKFDPIPITDYYALAGIFRSTQTLTPGNVSGWVEQELPMEESHRQALEAHQEAVKPVENELEQARTELKKLEDQLAAKGGVRGTPDPADLPGIVVDDTQAKVVGTWNSSSHTPNYVGTSYIHDGNADKGEKSVTFEPELPGAGVYELRLSYAKGGNRADNVPVTVHHADGEEVLHVDQQPAPPIDGLFVSLGQFRFDSGRGASVVISNEGTSGHVIADAVQFLPVELEDAELQARLVENDAEEESEEQKLARLKLESELADTETRVKQLDAALRKLNRAAPPPPPVAMSVQEHEETGDFHVCIRGSVHNLGPEVSRGFLSVMTPGGQSPISADESGRRELADWLADEANPLTPRVITNRIWHHLLGAGIVRTVDNFGRTGEAPSHPELLDWLAVRFIEDGWSVKSMVRQIVLSQTYQQSTAFPSGRLAVDDPENRLFGRMNRRRLDAEAIRDSILFVSDRLDPAQGGSTIKPGTARQEFSYTFDGSRRSVYVPVFRHTLDELFEVFDFADPNLVIGRRNTSTLPTQALYLMNSPFVMDHARDAAESLLAVPNLDDDARIDLAYRRTLGRLPTEKERDLAFEYLTAFASDEGNGAAQDQLDAWTNFYQALFGCVDFRYLN